MIELKCNNCLGKLSAGKDKIFMGEDRVIIKRDSSLKCEYCGTEYSPGDELDFAPDGGIQVSQEIGVVTGSVVGVSIDALGEKKKWWQFWK